MLCDDDPTFIFYRIAQHFGLPLVPDWAGWFKEELRRHDALHALVGLGCSPVLVTGTKKLFLKWIGRALRQKRIRFPESNGPVRWSVAHEFFSSGPTATEQPSSADGLTTVPLTRGEEES
ncbi:MAG TPA: hypothetical protein VG206_20630 [Terriglobia bacterium]|nr:hypothetical protein [Terriglobia bacterium]